MIEFCLVNDEGVVDEGFFSLEAAMLALAASDPEDELSIDCRENYDEDGIWIDEPDGDEDDDSDESDDEE